jgi:hypothetical protein
MAADKIYMLENGVPAVFLRKYLTIENIEKKF